AGRNSPAADGRSRRSSVSRAGRQVSRCVATGRSPKSRGPGKRQSASPFAATGPCPPYRKRRADRTKKLLVRDGGGRRGRRGGGFATFANFSSVAKWVRFPKCFSLLVLRLRWGATLPTASAQGRHLVVLSRQATPGLHRPTSRDGQKKSWRDSARKSGLS